MQFLQYVLAVALGLALGPQVAQAQDAPAKDVPVEDVQAEDSDDEDVHAKDSDDEDVPVGNAQAEDTDDEDAQDEDAQVEDVQAEDSDDEDAQAEQSPHDAAPGAFGNIHLNGRFDMNYERRGYSNQPFQAGDNALVNYHHFIFLSRDSKDDPFTFNAELVDLTFYEGLYRHQLGNVRLLARAGKILVPFGAEPLFHHTYGGLAGFDQRFLPVVWAVHGAAVQAQYRWHDVLFAGDLYAVQGHSLSDAESVLNLQSDISRADNVHIAIGDRLGASWGPISAWYSTYFSRLGFGRRLLLQAFDLTVWRIPAPVLRDISLGIGVIRADISGGGAGEDYYHFADYLQLRYQISPRLYVQYRAGLRTMNNRRGVVLDSTRLDLDDTSSHNLGIVARMGGVTASLFHFWNLEKRDEQDDDLLRATVAYDF